MDDNTEAWKAKELLDTAEGITIGGHQVMQHWERPIMERLAQLVTRNGGNILEVGFGLGMSASEIVTHDIESYTVIELHPDIIKRAKTWAESVSIDVHIIEGAWQRVIPDLDQKFDGILFDTYPLTEEEVGKNHFPFIATAGDLLNTDGVLTYYSDETRNFRTEHLSLILQHFNTIELHVVDGLKPPAICDYWQHDHTVIPVLSKPV